MGGHLPPATGGAQFGGVVPPRRSPRPHQQRPTPQEELVPGGLGAWRVVGPAVRQLAWPCAGRAVAAARDLASPRSPALPLVMRCAAAPQPMPDIVPGPRNCAQSLALDPINCAPTAHKWQTTPLRIRATERSPSSARRDAGSSREYPWRDWGASGGRGGPGTARCGEGRTRSRPAHPARPPSPPAATPPRMACAASASARQQPRSRRPLQWPPRWRTKSPRPRPSSPRPVQRRPSAARWSSLKSRPPAPPSQPRPNLLPRPPPPAARAPPAASNAERRLGSQVRPCVPALGSGPAGAPGGGARQLGTASRRGAPERVRGRAHPNWAGSRRRRPGTHPQPPRRAPAGFVCKCGQTFCGSHRYAEAHACTFDYKTTARERLAENNPLVQAAKVNKI